MDVVPAGGPQMMSRPAVVALAVTVLGVIAVGFWSARVEQQGVRASLSFEGVTPAASPEFIQRAGDPLTPEELRRIESVAKDELRVAYAMTCVTLSRSPDARYRLRVQPGTLGLAAAGSRSLPGFRGEGVSSFASIAASAVAFAPADATRQALVDAIGRGIGRTAAHELAHQLLGSFQLHDRNDRRSYEYPDLRPEHFYASLHWTIAKGPLLTRFGREGWRCSRNE